MAKLFIVLLSFSIFSFISALHQGAQKANAPHQATAAPEFKIPPEESARKNPVPATVASIASGKRLWSYRCAMCHAEDGSGKGELALEMKLALRDYRNPKSLEKFSDGDLFYILTQGKGQMVGEGTSLKPEQRWNLVNYIRSLAKAEPTKPVS